ncbi:hypothetical protein ES702_06127 [subsurface metagenome]
MVIRDLIPNKLTTFSTPFKRFGYVKIGGRGTLIKLNSGNLAIFNPVSLTPEVKAKVSQMATTDKPGSLKYIIAPDFEHHIFLGPWAKEYPEAEVIGMEGLPEKREKDPDTKGTKFHHVFTAGNKRDLRISPEFDDEFNYEYIHSHQNKELVFLHKPTSTLIEADLLFNLPATEQFSRSGEEATGGILSKVFASVMHTRGDMKWQKRLLWYGPGGSDRKGFAESVKRMDGWGEFERLIPCHGDVIERGGSRILREATAWYRQM